MDAEEFVRCFGRAADEPDVAKLVEDLGIADELAIAADRAVRIRLPDRGLLVVFSPYGTRAHRWRLTNVQFYSDAEDDFTSFPGALPKGLVFTDGPKEVRAKLGRPSQMLKEHRLDHWVEGTVQWTVRYRKELDGIQYVMLGYPRSTSTRRSI